MDLFLKQLINALNAGSIYALIAIGYTMVYGIIRLINFAHGDVMMFGAYFAFYTATRIPANYWETQPVLSVIAVFLVAMVLAALMGIIIERLAYRRLRNAPRISALITAIGMSLFLQNLAQLIFGASPERMPNLIPDTHLEIIGFSIPIATLYTIGISILMMVLLTLFIQKTKSGKAMRAVSQDQEAAKLMGINVNNVIAMTFAFGSALGALGGIFFSMAYDQIYPTLGVMPGLKAFVAAVLGGIGNIFGAMLGGYLIGAIETFTNAYISTRWADAIVFSILIFVLLFKPSGLLGKNLKEKV